MPPKRALLTSLFFTWATKAHVSLSGQQPRILVSFFGLSVADITLLILLH